MFFLLLGVVFTTLKYFGFWPVGNLSWLVVLSPFALAVAWWKYADRSGYSKRKAVEKMDKRGKERIEKHRVTMCTLPNGKRKP